MLIDNLTQQDKNMIDVLRDYGVSDYDVSMKNWVDVDYFLRFWNQNKNSLIQEIFGDKLILEKEFSVDYSDSELLDSMDDLLVSTPICSTLLDNIINYLTEHNAKFTPSFIYRLFSTSYLVQNKYLWDWGGSTITLEDGKEIKINKGCKVIKIIRKLAKITHNEELFEQFRLLHSQVLNEAHIKSTLCLSIHPLDYMTASYNNNGWDSCMVWGDGDYCRGVIEMMNSPCVVVAYLKSKQKVIGFDNYKWNSKRWREFFIIDGQGIFGIKGYPFWNTELEKGVLNWIRDLLPTNIQNHYTNQIIAWDTSDGVYIPKIEDYVQIEMNCGPAMYNDFYSDYTYQAILSNDALIDEYVHINYSGESECVICGENEADFDDTHLLFCTSCGNDWARCSHCGQNIVDDDDFVTFDDGNVVCSFCYDEYFPTCDICNEHLDTDSNGKILEEGGLLFTICDDDTLESPNIPKYFFGTICKYLVCPTCAEKFFVNGKEELITPHRKRKCGYNDLISLIPIRRIIHPSLLTVPESYAEEMGIKE